jgi:hypothetical protein
MFIFFIAAHDITITKHLLLSFQVSKSNIKDESQGRDMATVGVAKVVRDFLSFLHREVLPPNGLLFNEKGKLSDLPELYNLAHSV